MQTIKLKFIAFIAISFLLHGAVLTAQTNNIVPPSIGAIQNQTSVPGWLSPDNFSASNQEDQQTLLLPMEIVNETVWDGKTWSQGEPDPYTRAVLNEDYNTSSTINAYDIVIKDGVTLTLNENGFLRIKQPLSKATKAKIILNEDAGLLSRSPNSTLSVFERRTPKVNKFSSIYMSTPVAGTSTSGQKIGDTYDGLNATYDTAYGQYDSSGFIDPATFMIPGKGYIETVNGSGSFDTPGLVPNEYWHTYTGTENTGNYSRSVNNGYNLLGNPYADSLDADSFLLDSSNTTVSAIFLWTRNTLASSLVSGSGNFNFSALDYAVYNVLGGINAGKNITLDTATGTTLVPISPRENIDIPDGKIARATAFYVRTTGSGTATFKNTMTTSPTLQIFRSANHKLTNTALITPPTRSRIWINLAEGSSFSATSSQYRQTLIGYATGATNADNDRLFDAAPLTHATYVPAIDVYSFAPSSSTHLAIQGRDNFLNTDTFALGYKTKDSGTFTFSTTHDGIFNTQGYYILDAIDGNYHTLPYTFTTAAGTFDSRFKIVFEHLTGVVSDPLTCGTTLANSSTTIYSLQITGATTYMFEVTRDNPPGTGTLIGEYTGNAGAIHKFNLNFSPILYDTYYYIRVATYQINGVWAYGPVCMVRTPSPPTTGMVYPTPCGSTITNSWTSIYAGQVNGIYGISATQYRFNVTCSSNGTTYQYYAPTLPLNSTCNLHKFGSMPILPNTNYTFTVDIFWDGAWRNGTDQCIITTGNPITKQLLSGEDSFDVQVYPNPFTNNVNLDLNSSIKDIISVNVYDMVGRLMESRKVIPSEMPSQQMGDEYLSGVYNIVISQGENVKTLRVIKR